MSIRLKNRLIEPLASLAFPPVCQICDVNSAQQADGYVCTDCQQNVHPIRPPWCARCGQQLEQVPASNFDCNNCHETEWAFDSARSLFASRGLVREVVHRFKYSDATYLHPLIKNWLRDSHEIFSQQPDWIVPIPLHPVKERERGFNQAERLAKWISGSTGTSIKTGSMRRVKFTKTQTNLSRKQRLANMRDAFAPVDGRPISGSILLVDDVMTTGATAGACATVLKGAGAQRVEVLTLVRGLPF